MYRRIPTVLVALLMFPPMGAVDALAAAAQTDGRNTRVRNLHWVELLPEHERDGYIPGPPPPNHGYLDGPGSSPFGRFGQQERLDCTGLARRFNPDCEDAGQQSMSGAVNEGLDGQTVRLSGYIVPLEVGPNGRVTQFFLAPYAGACIHVPPPAPNQMVYIKAFGGQRIDSIYDAYTVTGVLHARIKSVGQNAAAYTLDLQAMQRLR